MVAIRLFGRISNKSAPICPLSASASPRVVPEWERYATRTSFCSLAAISSHSASVCSSLKELSVSVRAEAGYRYTL